MSTKIIDLCGDVFCKNEATKLVELDRVDPRARAIKMCNKHIEELRTKCKREDLKVDHLIVELRRELPS